MYLRVFVELLINLLAPYLDILRRIDPEPNLATAVADYGDCDALVSHFTQRKLLPCCLHKNEAVSLYKQNPRRQQPDT